MDDEDSKFYKKPVGVDQTPGLCGPAVLKSILHFYGINEKLIDITDKIGATEKDGIEAIDLVKGAQKFGLKGKVVDNSSFEQINKLLNKDYQIIVEWYKPGDSKSEKPIDDTHYSVVTEMNATEMEIMDPETGDYKYITKKEFEPVWFTYKENGDKVEKRIIVLWKEDKLGEKRMRTYHKHKKIPDNLYKKIITQKVGPLFGYEIYLVNGKVVRNSFDIDFVMGGNPGRYSYVPNKEIWIEDHYAEKELIPIAIHEVIECEYMIRDGDDYDTAHDKATKHEKDLRNNDIRIKNLKEAEDYISGVFGKKKNASINKILKFANTYYKAAK